MEDWQVIITILIAVLGSTTLPLLFCFSLLSKQIGRIREENRQGIELNRQGIEQNRKSIEQNRKSIEQNRKAIEELGKSISRIEGYLMGKDNSAGLRLSEDPKQA